MGLIRIPHMMDPELASGFRYKWDSLRRCEHSLRNIAYFCVRVTIENSYQYWYQFLLPSLIQDNFEGIFTIEWAHTPYIAVSQTLLYVYSMRRGV